jgi:hypothetical protein
MNQRNMRRISGQVRSPITTIVGSFHAETHSLIIYRLTQEKTRDKLTQTRSFISEGAI